MKYVYRVHDDGMFIGHLHQTVKGALKEIQTMENKAKKQNLRNWSAWFTIERVYK